MSNVLGSNWHISDVCAKAGPTKLFDDRTVQCFEDDRYKIVTLGAFDLLEGLDILMFGAVHDREDLGNEASFTTGPLAGGAAIC